MLPLHITPAIRHILPPTLSLRYGFTKTVCHIPRSLLLFPATVMTRPIPDDVECNNDPSLFYDSATDPVSALDPTSSALDPTSHDSAHEPVLQMRLYDVDGRAACLLQ